MDHRLREIDPGVHGRVVGLAQEADELVERGAYRDALVLYDQALALLPEPRDGWGATVWLLGSIGDVAFRGGYHEVAREALGDAFRCPGALGNPFLHLRLGEVHVELGDETRAVDELMRAYMGAGPDIFEHEDPKYLALLQRHAILPE